MKINIIIIVVALSFIIFSSTGTYSTPNLHNIIQYGSTKLYEENNVLITGFGPFDNYEINPSELIVRELDGNFINNSQLIGIILPVDFEESVNVAIQAIEEYTPSLIISLGLSPKAHLIEIETFGINLKQKPIGNREWLFPRRINTDGPLLRMSTFKTKDIMSALKKEGIPVKQSFFAGMYICNTVLYEILGYIDDKNLPLLAGFIHVPMLSSQNSSGMNLDIMIEAVQLSIISNL